MNPVINHFVMKKALICFAISLLFFGVVSYENIYASSFQITSEAMSVRSITVYMIKSHSSAKKSATYDSDNNTITVDGNTYSVKDNPEYGHGGKTGQYAYVAGGCYYFNL